MKIKTFSVIARVPEKLKPLPEIANNLWFSWYFPAIELFKRLDPDVWEESNYNPKYMLNIISQETLKKAAEDESFISYMNEVYGDFKAYLKGGDWFKKNYASLDNKVFAYFSMEFGLDECLPIYSGGLGILSGDHLKAASDLNLPLVGVGFLYQQGYFKQYLNADGWQQEVYPENEFFYMPVSLATDAKREPIKITLDCQARKVVIQVWECMVGRVKLLLLDSNLLENTPEDRLITAQLYGGNIEMRIKQELLLGIGGVRALYALKYDPAVFHMNEGHSAFLSLERIKRCMTIDKLSLKEAFNFVKTTNVFTTHTPVAAGNDRFENSLLLSYLTKFLMDIGMSEKAFIELGRENPKDESELFCMTVLALKTAMFCNGVSKLHGEVSRSMWNSVWPGLPRDEVPIKSITNGVHIRTWVSHDLADLYNRYLGPNWGLTPDKKNIWERVDSIPDIELWGTHERRRERLVSFARNKIVEQLKQKGVGSSEIERAGDILNPKALTIGFAKRFTTYKRATLIFKDLVRLAKILSDEKRPVQIIFAGKAHPHDNPGKKFIQDIIRFGGLREFKNKIVFLEDYDLSISRYLVQGCDVWLNTPRRPLEASGTSGMKAAANGVLNLSVLDGWWTEGYNAQNGWAIGQGEEYDDLEIENHVESMQIYNLLEKEIIPLFYNRHADGMPRDWIAKMKESIKSNCYQFNTSRMVSEYCQKFYIPAFESAQKLQLDKWGALKKLTVWKERLFREWKNVRVLNSREISAKYLKVDEKFSVTTDVFLGRLNPEDVNVEIYYGVLDRKGRVFEPINENMILQEAKRGDVYSYTITIACSFSGRYGYAVRVLPKNELLPHPYEMGWITWEK
ncbi:alpha-glucan family phosphorylase [bacterium]|nr:alpha-glucan family phosphorylase [bacterium]MBT3581193.1 alpha-glucan family phosphorylase [bacterium]MBT7088769.1 alpha-glucan family phosphorylase [bacterium]